MQLDVLRKVGLSEGEIKVYLVLLTFGSAHLNKIHEKTGIERRNIYDILNKLIERGLVSYMDENKRRSFTAVHPKKLISYLEEKQENLLSIKQEVNKMLPAIIKVFESKKSLIGAEIYRGEEGIKAVWEDSLNYKETYWIGSGRYVPKKFPLFFSHWNKRRVQKKHHWWNLIRGEIRKELYKPLLFENHKFLPREFSGNPTVICIYGNKVVNFLYGESLFAFVIESKELADNYRTYHKYLWDNVAKPK
ncbi:MAG: helix-turn-helix domain-containing protein [Nanoarchaeota archaeon]